MTLSVDFYKKGGTFDTEGANLPISQLDDGCRFVAQQLNSLVKVVSVISVNHIGTNYQTKTKTYQITNYDGFSAYAIINKDKVMVSINNDIITVTFPAGVSSSTVTLSRDGIESSFYVEFV